MSPAAAARPERPRRTSRLRWPRSAARLAPVSLPLPLPLPLAAAARGAFALALPLFVGVCTGWVMPSVIAAIGALWGVSQDGSDPYRVRVRRLGWTGVSSAFGLLAGELALRSAESAAVTGCLVAAALVAGTVSLRGRIASVSGMHLLLGVTIGTGIPVPGPWWQPPLALLAGVALVLVLSAAPWLWRRHHVERAAVLAVYRSAGDALAAAGTQDAEEARRRMTLALNHAHEVMAVHLTPRTRRRQQTEVRELVRAFHHAVRLGEAVTALVWEARPLPPALTGVPLRLAERLLPGQVSAPAPAGTAAEQSVPGPLDADSPGRSALAALWAGIDEPDAADPTLRLPAHTWPGGAARLRYAVLLAGCVLVAHLLAEALHGPRGYWLPMTVAFVYKPDFGPVFTRALHRSAGTVVGVAAIGAVSVAATGTYTVIGVVAVFGALMAVGVRHHYALATVGLTAVVFVLLDLLGDHRALYGTRILDTALASALVLAAHFVVWPDSAGHRALAQTEAAVAAARRYHDVAPEAGPAQRQSLRRTAYHQLAQARRAIAHARGEPVRPGRSLADWEDAITVAERLCDRVTAQVVAGAAHPRR
ncbi:putative membrane protein YccC [Streptomyces sp. LBL]|uniref:FUSC family protein n=1 Tax=Streptomyces sp. LBL TaxID=2940562 RepID=UPI002474F324|nr:FUSC family protein [Streptomyces sp. LBL]MDH6629666.1 putative membrane protein YccC [Streptomyces sp. LBL]